MQNSNKYVKLNKGEYMKKVVWVFGESATGKKTFIVNLLNNNEYLIKEIGLVNKKISVVNCTIEETNESFDDCNSEIARQNKIMQEIDDFIKSENEVLLIKGQANDMDDRYGNTLKLFADKYPEIDKDIILLEVEDMDLLYERITNKSWFKEDKERYSNLFPRTWIDKAVLKHRRKVESYSQFGYNIVLVDSTKDFIFKEKGNVKNG